MRNRPELWDAVPKGQSHCSIVGIELRQPEAIANVMRHLKPGARVVACGLKGANAWALPANVFVLLAARHSTTTLQGLYEPWSGARYIAPIEDSNFKHYFSRTSTVDSERCGINCRVLAQVNGP